MPQQHVPTHDSSRWSAWLVSLVCGIVLLLFLPLAHASTSSAIGLRVVGDQSRVRIVIEFADKPEIISSSYLAGPYRFIVDLPETVFAFQSDQVAARGMLEEVRYGLIGAGRSRMIFTFNQPFVSDELTISANETGGGYRLLIDSVASSRSAFETVLANRLITNSVGATTPKSDRIGTISAPDAARPFTVVLDPGHGGIDGGASGVTGTVEKEVTLNFAMELRETLAQNSDIRVVMTRDADAFLRLDERITIARQNNADLFVSIHADTIRIRGVRGATVYTISDEASDDIARQIAESENEVDSIAGMEIPEESTDVADILVDLARRETQALSIRFAQKLVGQLENHIELIGNPLRSAGFRVLKAPDVPSVLVELGYLSNPDDEKLLNDHAWRQKTVEHTATAILGYAAIVRGTRQAAGK
jgi:N-acetylmuramoyl-L-alanine amidase